MYYLGRRGEMVGGGVNSHTLQEDTVVVLLFGLHTAHLS